jgi:hypothetical protein
VSLWDFADRHPFVFLLACVFAAFGIAGIGPFVIVRKDKS